MEAQFSIASYDTTRIPLSISDFFNSHGEYAFIVQMYIMTNKSARLKHLAQANFEGWIIRTNIKRT